MKVKGFYVFMLVYVDEEWMDVGGNKYPLDGYIEAEKFTKDIDIRYGLYGIPWGKTRYFPYEKRRSGHWLVVKTEMSEDIIETDKRYNRSKFKQGSVIYAGNLKDAARFIISHKNDRFLTEEAKWLQPEEIAGSKEWMKEHKLQLN